MDEQLLEQGIYFRAFAKIDLSLTEMTEYTADIFLAGIRTGEQIEE